MEKQLFTIQLSEEEVRLIKRGYNYKHHSHLPFESYLEAQLQEIADREKRSENEEIAKQIAEAKGCSTYQAHGPALQAYLDKLAEEWELSNGDDFPEIIM